jgi:hypothetical protein
MADDKANCPGCPDAGTLDFSKSRVVVPDDFMADKLGTMEQQVAEGMAALERIRQESPPHSPQLETPTIQPGLITEPHTPDFTGDTGLEAPAITTGKNFSTAETDAPIVPIQFQRGGGARAAAFVGARLAAYQLKLCWLASGKDKCNAVDFSAALECVTKANEDCSKLVGSERVLCIVRNETRDEYSKAYAAANVGRNQGQWLWELRRQFNEICSE